MCHGSQGIGALLPAAVLAVCLGVAPDALAADPVVLDESSGVIDLSPHLEILPDPEHRFTIDDVTSMELVGAFRPVDQNTLSLGLTHSAFWLRFTVENQQRRQEIANEQWFLTIERPPVFNIALYTPVGRRSLLDTTEYEVQIAGDPGIDQAEAVRQNRLIFPILKSAGETTFHVRVDSPYTTIFLPMHIVDLAEGQERFRKHTYWFGAYGGLSLAMAALNLAFFIFLRDRSHMLYVLHVLSWWLYFSEANGLVAEILLPKVIDLTQVANISQRFSILMLGLGIAFAASFTRSFLFTVRGPRWCDRVLAILTFLGAGLAAISPFGPNLILNQLASVLGLASPFMLLAAGITSWRAGFLPARFFLLAWFCLIAGGFTFALAFNGLITLTAPISHAFQIGSAFEQMLLTVALADRFSILSEQHRTLQHREERYREQAFTDALTGLFNRRYLSTHLPLLVERAEATHRPLSILVLDVDAFKDFNDSWGHAAGDDALRCLGSVILNCLRDTDIPCRHGGEEFVVALPDTARDEAGHVAERIRVEFARFVVSAVAKGSGANATSTVSIGVAEHVVGQDQRELFERADEALYRAKEEGKNRVVVDTGSAD